MFALVLNVSFLDLKERIKKKKKNHKCGVASENAILNKEHSQM